MFKRFLHIAFIFALCFFVFIPTSFAAAPDRDSLPEFPTEPFDDTGYICYYNEQNDKTFLIYYDKSHVATVSTTVNGAIIERPNIRLYNTGSYPGLQIISSKKVAEVFIHEYVLQSDNTWGLSSTRTRDASINEHQVTFSLPGEIVSDENNNLTYVSKNGFNPVTFYYSSTDLWIIQSNSAKVPTVFFPLTLPGGAPTLVEMIQAVATAELQIQQSNLGGTMMILMVCGVGLIALLIGFLLFGKVLRRFLGR